LFGVTNPIKLTGQGIIGQSDVIKYTVTGQDREGKFEVQRRYNEFHMLHLKLNERWPGCFIPCIPEK